ncbi:hypothetical protein [Clostridium sp.]|uniref:hypothetical protein n=1 Tax=Clostridium sp. TaxID=1506 RepID=UPI0032180ADC
MVSKYNFKVLINPGKTRYQDCCCSAYDPGCQKGYNEECILINYSYDPYADIESCMNHDSYKRVSRRLRQR